MLLKAYPSCTLSFKLWLSFSAKSNFSNFTFIRLLFEIMTNIYILIKNNLENNQLENIGF